MKRYHERIRDAKIALAETDRVLIGAGAGFSAAAGLRYDGPRFTNVFRDFIDRYHFTDMYTSGFYHFPTPEAKWAYWARHIYLNRYAEPPAKLYHDLLSLVAEKEYFVITTNTESQFEKSGFQIERIFEVQGNYGQFQCEIGCHDTLYDNETIVKKMIERTSNLAIPHDLIPICPKCGRCMDVHLRKDRYFVQDSHWYRMHNAYRTFIEQSQNKPIVLMELGVGFNTPTIIRYPFERYTDANPNATLLRLNKNHPFSSVKRSEQFIAFDEDISDVFADLAVNNDA